MNQHLQTILDFIQQAEHLTAEEKVALLKAAKNADKELEITSFKLERTEKVKHTTAILLEETIEELEQKRKAVEAQNKELEIESALERVRSVALAMKGPDDMLDVCKVIATELNKLDVKEIRNVQTAIFYETKGVYINYEFYAKHDKTLITEVDYSTHTVQSAFAEQMMKGPNEFFTQGFTGKQVQDWYAYQKTTNVFLDSYLEHAGSLNYYWYSLGPVALGMSTYLPLSEEQIILFQRFRNVFGLAYRRYLDIEQALAQAKEARIETALERVRAVAMAMRKPDELALISTTIYTELTSLDFSDLRNAEIIINNDSKETIISYYSDYGISGVIEIDYKTNLIVQGWANDLRKANDAFVEIIIPENEMDAWRKYREEIGYLPDAKLNEAKTVYYYSYSIGLGALSISSFRPITKEQIKILERFRNVFKLSYQRYIDIEHAEVQAREAQIELALERVRARTMAMYRSDELSEVVYILFQQFKELGENPDQATIGIINEDEWVIEYWVTMYGNQNNKVYKFSIDEPNVTNRIYRTWKEQKKSLVIDLSGQELHDFTRYRASMGGAAAKEDEKRRIINVAFFSKGLINVQSNEERSAESIQLLERFSQVFDLTYTRFLDLQKAEAQAREAQIEVALERVRSRSMGMQKSEELKEVIRIVYEQFVHLNINIDHAGFVVDYKQKGDWHFWIADEQEIPSKITHPYFDSVWANQFNEAKEKGIDFFATSLNFEEKNKFYKELLSYVPGLPEESKNFYLSAPGVAASTVLFDNVSLYIENFSGIPYTDDENVILMRFGKVFEQTYTRFLDLQKAEAQSRESQIQLALERARTQSMIMQHSNELDDTLRVFHAQVLLLEIPSAFSFLWLPDEDKDQHIFWAAWAENNSTVFKSKAINYPLDRNEPATAQCLIDWKSNEPVVAYHVAPASVKDYFAAWSELISGVDELKPENFSDGLYYVEAFMKYGCFGVMVKNTLPEDEKKILSRFAVEFERAYTRFLDLQKAEAQAKESQVQLALERVRARTMAMQHSNELPDAANILFQQIQTLGMPAWSAGYCIWDDDKQAITLWMSSAGIIQKPFRAPVTEDPSFIHFYDAWKRGETFYVEEIGGNAIISHYQYMLQLPVVGEMLKQFIADGGSLPTFQIYHLAFFSQGFLLFITYEPVPEAHDIFKRFGKVFEQTYTRFLDLQKAEAQARESQIQLALERVRARTMAMQHSDELKDAAALLFQQVKSLGAPAYSCGYNIWEKDEKEFTSWMSTQDGSIINGVPNIRLTEDANFIRYVESKENDEPFFVLELRGERMQEHYAYLKTIPAFNAYFDYAISVGFDLPETQIHHLANFSHGNLLFITLEPCPEFHDVFKRFASVFEQTYTRFLDLQKAEAQAREAKIEAAMEKVRSRAMAMQKPDELVEVAQLLRKEMNSLGIEELETSSIYIHHEDTQKTECWYAIKDVEHPEKELVSDHMTIDLTETWVGKEMLAFYHSGKKQISISMQGINRKEWINYCAAHSKVLVGFYGDNIPDRTYHLYKFSNGYMGAASPGDISKESWDLLQRATSVFSLAYTRFSDLQQAEAQAREANIETALERVRSRTLAMQRSEELAETAAVLFKQLILLGIEPNRLYINIIRDETGEGEFWITDEDGSKVSSAFAANMNNNDSLKKMYEGWKEKKKSLIIDMQGNELQQYFDHLTSLNVPFKDGLTQKRRIQHIAYFSKGFIGMASPDEQPEGTTFLLERFAGVFNLTFTRFNDLKIAEAHAIQAEQDLIALMAAKKKAEDALTELKATQSQLIQSEKMASLGELTAGIAHEIQNPLNFVNNFSEVNTELIEELKEELQQGNTEEVIAIANDIKENEQKINHHGKRADAIVKGMLQHSRSSSNVKEPTNINALADEYLRLAYHGLRAKDKSFNATLNTAYDDSIETVNIIPQDIGRVTLNLITNAFYAVNEKKKNCTDENYEPTVSISTKKVNDKIEIKVSDNGNGIPQKIVDKIFQPFFTTKPTGQGTGLGLSLSYDIIKAHGGEIRVESKEGEGATFIIQLPVV